MHTSTNGCRHKHSLSRQTYFLVNFSLGYTFYHQALSIPTFRVLRGKRNGNVFVQDESFMIL